MIRLYTDAAVNGDLGQAGIGLLFIANKKQKQYSIPLEGKDWNNHLAEFHALAQALQLLVDKKKTNEMTFGYTDSRVLSDAIEKSYVKNKDFNKYLQKILKLMQKFDYISIQWIPDRENKGADNLARQALQTAKTKS